MAIGKLWSVGKAVYNSKGFAKLVRDTNGNRYLALFNKEGKFLRGIVQSPWQEVSEGSAKRIATRVFVDANGEPYTAKLLRRFFDEGSHIYRGSKEYFASIMRNCGMNDFKKVFTEEYQKIVDKVFKPVKKGGFRSNLPINVEPNPRELLTGELKMPKPVVDTSHNVEEVFSPQYDVKF